MLLSTKQSSYRQSNAPVGLGQNSAPAAKKPKSQYSCEHAPVDKLCSRRHHNAPVGMLLSIKLCSGRHSIAPVGKTMLLSTKQCSYRQHNVPVELGQNSAPAARTPKPQYSCGHAPVDKTLLLSIQRCWDSLQFAPVEETMLLSPMQTCKPGTWRLGDMEICRPGTCRHGDLDICRPGDLTWKLGDLKTLETGRLGEHRDLEPTSQTLQTSQNSYCG